MDVNFSAEQEQLRRKARAWLAKHRPMPLPLALEERFEALLTWQRILYDGGWIGLAWPKEYGGRGGSPLDQVIFNQELARAGSPSPIGLIGLEVVGPTILKFGTEEQKQQYVPPLLRGDQIWCQGFSEPNAGSDLAALRTRASIEDGHFVISGQKVWTSWAQYAHWCAVLARTDPDAVKHRGISYILVDMSSPGITVRPLVQLTGNAEFNEVFFDEVRVPTGNLLGPLHDGWRVAMHTLAFERGPFTLKRQTELRVALDALVRQLSENHPSVLDNPLVRHRLGRCEMLVEVLAAQGYRTASRIEAGDPGAESSIEKLFLAEVEQTLCSAALDVLGGCPTVTSRDHTIDRATWVHDYLYSRAVSIYGGTSEIQRGIVAQRVLGLPKG